MVIIKADCFSPPDVFSCLWFKLMSFHYHITVVCSAPVAGAICNNQWWFPIAQGALLVAEPEAGGRCWWRVGICVVQDQWQRLLSSAGNITNTFHGHKTHTTCERKTLNGRHSRLVRASLAYG